MIKSRKRKEGRLWNPAILPIPPVWCSIFVFGVQALIDYYGEIEFAEKLYPDLKEYTKLNVDEIESLGWVWGTRGLCDWIAPSCEENGEVQKVISVDINVDRIMSGYRQAKVNLMKLEQAVKKKKSGRDH